MFIPLNLYINVFSYPHNYHYLFFHFFYLSRLMIEQVVKGKLTQEGSLFMNILMEIIRCYPFQKNPTRRSVDFFSDIRVFKAKCRDFCVSPRLYRNQCYPNDDIFLIFTKNVVIFLTSMLYYGLNKSDLLENLTPQLYQNLCRKNLQIYLF